MIPNVLIGYHARPMCAGLFFGQAFRQAGCRVLVAGPSTGQVYGRGDGTDHTFDPEDFLPSDLLLPNEPVDVQHVINLARERGFAPDLVVMLDQYDPFHFTGSADVPFTFVTVENWGEMYAARLTAARVDAHFHMIAHQHGCAPPPLPPDTEWMAFGFDPQIHPFMPTVERDKWVVQIGTAYEPRPQIWNHLRMTLDGADGWGAAQYLRDVAESPHTIFGRIPSYRGMAVAHNRARIALSSSNCDFSPMRTCEAYGMGCVLVSDDVPAIRGVLGPPLSEGGFWVAHDRTPAGTERAVRQAVEAYPDIIDRGMAHVFKHHTYRARAERILARAGLQGACRLV